MCANNFQALERGLSSVGLACVARKEHVPVGKLTRPNIDHICVPEARVQRSKVVEAWPRRIDGVRLSDHRAVIVAVGS